MTLLVEVGEGMVVTSRFKTMIIKKAPPHEQKGKNRNISAYINAVVMLFLSTSVVRRSTVSQNLMNVQEYIHSNTHIV